MICNSDTTPVTREWVVISCGLYKGDLAFISSVQDWEGVSVLLIPRISYGDDSPLTSKRKRSAIRPPPQLFDPKMVPTNACIQPVCLRDHIYKFGLFKKGLLQ
jgi:hypothetical protein